MLSIFLPLSSSCNLDTSLLMISVCADEYITAIRHTARTYNHKYKSWCVTFRILLTDHETYLEKLFVFGIIQRNICPQFGFSFYQLDIEEDIKEIKKRQDTIARGQANGKGKWTGKRTDVQTNALAIRFYRTYAQEHHDFIMPPPPPPFIDLGVYCFAHVGRSIGPSVRL